MNVEKLPPHLFEEIYSQVPRLCVEAVIEDKDGFLLARRGIEPQKGMWHFIGGTVLMGESLEEAVRRIAKEEAGVEVEVGSLAGVIEFSQGSAFGQVVSLAYLCRITGGELTPSEQATEFLFCKAPPADMVSEQKEFLEGLKNG